MGHHNGTIVGGEGKPGKDHREAQAADSQRVTAEGLVSPPNPQTPCTAGMVPHACEWTLCFHVGKTLQFQETTQQILPHLAPSSPPLSAIFLLSWGMEGLGNFCALVIFSLGLPAAAATCSSCVSAPEPAWLCQSPAWPQEAPLLGLDPEDSSNH